MFSLTCIITVESTAQIEAQWSIQSTCFHCRQMWPHTDLTSASCCVPCRHVIPTVCLLYHSSTHRGDAETFSVTDVGATEESDLRKDLFITQFRMLLLLLHLTRRCGLRSINVNENTFKQCVIRIQEIWNNKCKWGLRPTHTGLVPRLDVKYAAWPSQDENQPSNQEQLRTFRTGSLLPGGHGRCIDTRAAQATSKFKGTEKLELGKHGNMSSPKSACFIVQFE